MFDPADGKSLLCLLTDPTGASCDYAPNPGPWRTYIDMEHSECYNMTNHWSALTDGQTKYVFRAWAGDEQLFDLKNDPRETVDVSGVPSYSAVLQTWRQRMVTQFQTEHRGPLWVSEDGKLQIRSGKTNPKFNYSPNYPFNPQARPGDSVVGLTSNGEDCSAQADPTQCWAVTDTPNSSSSFQDNVLGLNPSIKLLNTLEGLSLCLSASGQPGENVTVAKCDPQQNKAQGFYTSNHTSPAEPAAIKHASSGLCVTAAGDSAAVTVELAPCVAVETTQQWIFGTSGRFCINDRSLNNTCLAVQANWGPG